ncbi:Uncharacterised protein [Mycobacteroides abscessus subsp. abscessus]|nr:Uncharacterised protein [Mycobacteroides abscessus subsp. abscessus]
MWSSSAVPASKEASSRALAMSCKDISSDFSCWMASSRRTSSAPYILTSPPVRPLGTNNPRWS